MTEAIRARILKQVHLVQSYQSPPNVSAARRLALTPDIEDELEIEATVLVSMNPELDDKDALAIALMDWFKKKFFTWFNAPPNSTPLQGTTTADGERMERYQLADGSIEEFIRHNDPIRLIQASHRKGRCGEWANAFGFLCAVMGFEVRHISATFEDHVWVEIWSERRQKWVHFDPCENEYDKPLLYELGWGKKLSYVIATQRDLVVDVSGKYSISHDVIETNQKAQAIQPAELKDILKTININLTHQLELPQTRIDTLKKRRRDELALIKETGKLTREGLAGDFSGRTSGDTAWRLQRGEAKKSEISSSSNKSLKVQSCIAYNCAKDEFMVDGAAVDGGLLGNCKRVSKFFRKYEADWKTSYLAREEGSERGFVKMCVELGKHVSEVNVENLVFKTYESGMCKASIFTEHEAMEITNGKTYKFEKPVDKFSIYLVTFDSAPDKSNKIQWQHGQFFRVTDDSEEKYQFKISVSN